MFNLETSNADGLRRPFHINQNTLRSYQSLICLGSSGSAHMLMWQPRPRCLMKRADTIAWVLKGKPDHSVLAVTSDHSVYEAIEKMAVEGVGAMLVISANQLVGILSERDDARKVILRGRHVDSAAI